MRWVSLIHCKWEGETCELWMTPSAMYHSTLGGKFKFTFGMQKCWTHPCLLGAVIKGKWANTRDLLLQTEVPWWAGVASACKLSFWGAGLLTLHRARADSQGQQRPWDRSSALWGRMPCLGAARGLGKVHTRSPYPRQKKTPNSRTMGLL